LTQILQSFNQVNQGSDIAGAYQSKTGEAGLVFFEGLWKTQYDVDLFMNNEHYL